MNFSAVNIYIRCGIVNKKLAGSIQNKKLAYSFFFYYMLAWLFVEAENAEEEEEKKRYKQSLHKRNEKPKELRY